MEYNYAGLENTSNQGRHNPYVYDLRDEREGGNAVLAGVVRSKYNSSMNLVIEGNSLVDGEFQFHEDYSSGFVLPTNVSESKFIQCSPKNMPHIWDAGTVSGNMSYSKMDGLGTDNSSDILFDKFRLHFTSRKYMGDYDGFIIRATVYDKIKNKISLLSHYIRKTDDVNINESPLLINQKLYTTYLDFEIPSVNGLLNASRDLPGEAVMLNSLLNPDIEDNGIMVMDNSPLVFSIYGVKNTYDFNSYEIYNVEKLNTIYVPIQDPFNRISLTVKESDSGDYFEIYPVIDDDTMSFSDYIYNISDGRPEVYIIFHDLTLTEYMTDSANNVVPKVTHREQYIVNAAQILEDGSVEINEDEIDRMMIYRPVIMNSGRLAKFVINDQMKILNTMDNTTIVQEGSCEYGEMSGQNPKKYGKKMGKIYLGEIPTKVNVYSKRPDEDTDRIKITNASSNVKIENHQHSVIGFIESINVGVSIEQIPIEAIDN